MKFKIITIFPEFFESALQFSLLKKAQERGLIQIEIHNLRKWAVTDSIHKQVDARPYGGGPGMVMMVEPLYKAITALRTSKSKVVIFSPKGQQYDQVQAESFAQQAEELILISPHYEGFDERILNFVDYELSIGSFVLTGGEIPTLTVIDSVARLLPGVVGNEDSIKSESFSQLKEGIRNLEHAQYTRPEIFTDNQGNEYAVPSILLSGHHKNIENYRKEASDTATHIPN